jgi:hypothetical protein
MILHGDKAQVQARFSPFGDSANLNARLFWTPAMVLQDDEAQLEEQFSPFGDSANLDAR